MRLSELKGIGPKTEALFLKTGVDSVESLLEYYPVNYEEYTEPVPVSGLVSGRKCAVSIKVTGSFSVYKTEKLAVSYLDVGDASGKIRLVWYNSPYIQSVIKRGMTYIFRGNTVFRRGFPEMEHPEIYSPLQYRQKMNTLGPVYGLTKGLSNNMVSKAVMRAFETGVWKKEYLPEQIVRSYGLTDESEAAFAVHFPTDHEKLTEARSRLAFDEFFTFILAIRLLREKAGEVRSAYCLHKVWETEDVIEKLPFRLTAGQMRVWREIEEDLSGGHRMTRLIQGDVGSGKTILAFLAMIMTAAGGYQSALMAPTEVLARQHYEKLTDLVSKQNIEFVRAVLLTGALGPAEKRRVQRAISSGDANVIIGTHALIQTSVQYHELALVITDEQHRFGVYQRQALSEHDNPPHMIAMSATPIPRTLGVIFYGDLDISILDELPAKRLPIKNCVVDTSWRPNAYRFLRKELDAGHQVYIICPMIEPSEGLDAENVLEYTMRIKEEFPDIAVESLHGRMRADDKNDIMERFSKGEIKILVSTTVVEVGVDVPNATVILIENAERFGLAALHQLRGRVGRGDAQSYCIFMVGHRSEEIRERLDILNHSNDGFEIAEKDFEIRGPGDLLGIRQSGDAVFQIADIQRDRDTLKKAGELAAIIINDDPGLVLPEHAGLRNRMKLFFDRNDSMMVL